MTHLSLLKREMARRLLLIVAIAAMAYAFDTMWLRGQSLDERVNDWVVTR